MSNREYVIEVIVGSTSGWLRSRGNGFCLVNNFLAADKFTDPYIADGTIAEYKSITHDLYPQCQVVLI